MAAKNRKISTLQTIAFVILLIYVLNLAEGIYIVIKTGQWNSLVEKLLSLLIFGFIAYRSWESIRHGRESYRQRFEKQKENVGLKDAAMFSLTWSKEIYKRIPQDRKPLVQNAFVLIAIAMGIAYLQFGSLLTILLIATLVLAGVNLLIWAVASEREERNRIQIEMETARSMQMSLMPEQDPEVRGFDISGCCIPALEVGGDLFDYAWFQKQKQKLGIAIVDVSGKGMDAAFTAVYTSGAFISEIQHQNDVVTVLENINSALYSRPDRTRFVTAFMLSLDVRSKRLDFVNAGQTRPLLLRDDQIKVLKNPGDRFPLGVMTSPRYESGSLQLQSGDVLLLYTDGVNEAMNSDLEMYGNHRLEDHLKLLGKEQLSSTDMIMAIKDRILEFSAPAQQHDDITIVCIQVE
jgi:serine phosphatase RsbU (regulator of sigma subunit)